MGKNKKSDVKSKEENSEKKTKGKSKHKDESVDEEVPKRPGSAVSQQFLPKKQQNATNDWRKYQQNDEQNGTYGYVPFKTAPLPIYGIRANINGKRIADNNINNNGTNSTTNTNNINAATRAPYLNSTYAPPQALRADSAMSARTNGLVFDSRPGSELGLYKSPSRYQSYTTLPRPEHIDVEVEELRPPGYPQQHQQQQTQQSYQQQHYGAFPQAQDIYDNGAIYGGIKGAQFMTKVNMASRPSSKMAQISAPCYAGPYDAFAINSPHMAMHQIPPNSAMFGDSATAHVADEINRLAMKPIVNWGILSLSSYLQIVFGSGLIGIGVARLFLHFESAKGYELIYGISVLLAGVVALFAARQRGYALAVMSFVQSIINALFFFLPLYSGIFPLLSGTASLPAVPKNSSIPIGRNGDSFEMNMAVSVLSILEFMTALVASIYGCKAIGALIFHVESLRLMRYGTEAPPYPSSPSQMLAYRTQARNESGMNKRPL